MVAALHLNKLKKDRGAGDVEAERVARKCPSGAEEAEQRGVITDNRFGFSFCFYSRLHFSRTGFLNYTRLCRYSESGRDQRCYTLVQGSNLG